MSSYSRRLKDIKYLELRGEQLEQIIQSLAQQLKDAGRTPMMPFVGSILGDEPITDITAGEFDF